MLTAERLREVIDYNPLTGDMSWRINPPRKKTFVGRRIEAVAANGYRYVGIDGKSYLCHRLAWLHVHGQWPEGQIDHMNGDRTDNRIANLRDVSGAINVQNRRAVRPTKKTSSLLGVFPAPSKRNPWAAAVRLNGKKIHVGVFPTEQAAHAAYVEAKRDLHAGCTL